MQAGFLPADKQCVKWSWFVWIFLFSLLGACLSYREDQSRPVWFLVPASVAVFHSEIFDSFLENPSVLFEASESEALRLLEMGVLASRLAVTEGSEHPELTESWFLPVLSEGRELYPLPKNPPQGRGLVYELCEYPQISPAEAFGRDFFWVHRLFPDELPQELGKIRQRLIRAVRERSVRVLRLEEEWLTQKEGSFYVELTKELGFSRREHLPLQEKSQDSVPVRILLFQALLVWLGFHFNPAFWWILVFMVYEYPLNVQLQGFVFAVLSVLYLSFYWVKPRMEQGWKGLFQVWFSLFFGLIFLGSASYLFLDAWSFEKRVFLPRGVKASLLLAPLLVIFFEVGGGLMQSGRNWFLRFRISKKTGFILLGLVILGIGLLILRSGNQTLLPASELELQIRAFLEDALIARPRTREMLFWVGLCGLMSSHPLFQFLALVSSAFLASSIFNTFSHLHTPYWMILLRVLNAWLLVSIPLFLFWLFWPQPRKGRLLLGYFGFGNLGDDLLLSAALKRYPQARFFSGERLLAHPLAIPRKPLVNFLLEARTAETLQIGPGGVLQDASSLGSFLWYSVHILLARFLGVVVEYRGVGFSPFLHPVSRVLLPWVIGKSRLEVRDWESRRVLVDLGVLKSQIEVSQDWVLRHPPFEKPTERGQKIGIVWRSLPDNQGFKALETILKRLEDEEVLLLLFEKDESLQSWCKNRFSGVLQKVYLQDEDEVFGWFSECRAMISMRYHGIVLAHQMGLPCLCVAYDAKCESLASDLGLKGIIRQQDLEKPQLWQEDLENFLATISSRSS